MDNTSMVNPAEVNCSRATCEDIDALIRRINDEKALQLIPVTIWTAMLMLIGTFGNMLVVYVYRRRFKKTSSNYFILTMAIFDLVACTIAMPSEIYDQRYPYAFYSNAGCKIFRSTETYALYGSTIVLVEIAFDRYFKICRPLMVVSLFKIKLLCAFAALLALVPSICASFLYGITRPEKTVDGVTVRVFDCSIDEKYRKSAFQSAYFGLLLIVFVGVFLVITALYVRIWVEIRRRQKMVIGDQISKPREEIHERKKMRVKYVSSMSDEDSCSNSNGTATCTTSSASRSRFASIASYASNLRVSRTTVILFAVTIAFFISYLPSIVNMVIRTVIKEKNQTVAGVVTSKFFSQFCFINNAINPIIYSFLNINFRRQARKVVEKLFCCRRRRYPQKSDSDRSTKKEMLPMDA